MGPPPQWQLDYTAYGTAATGHLSVLCSGLLIYSVLFVGGATKLKKPHMRLLLGMSLFDFFYSFFKAQSWWMAPPESGWEHARGNMALCQVQGFFTTFAHGTGAYNAMLSTYYWLTICKGFKVKKWIPLEATFHVVIVVMFISLAAIGVKLQLYNPIFTFCYVQSFPPGCELSEGAPPCDRWPPETLGLMHWIWGMAVVQISIVIVILTNIGIWRKVKSQSVAMDRYAVNDQTKKTVSSMERSAARSVMGRNSILAAKADPNEVSKEDIHANLQRNKRRELDARHKRERMVFYQCLLYSVAFVLCFIGPTMFHLAGWIFDSREFWHLAVLVTFTPLQGFFNLVIYTRPVYIRVRSKHPHLSMFQAMFRVLFVENPLHSETSGTTTFGGKFMSGLGTPNSAAPSAVVNHTSSGGHVSSIDVKHDDDDDKNDDDGIATTTPQSSGDDNDELLSLGDEMEEFEQEGDVGEN